MNLRLWLASSFKRQEKRDLEEADRPGKRKRVEEALEIGENGKRK